MLYKIEWDDRARKELQALETTAQNKILAYLRECTASEPRRLGKALGFGKKGLWSYRVGIYQLISLIEDNRLTVLVLSLEPRKNLN